MVYQVAEGVKLGLRAAHLGRLYHDNAHRFPVVEFVHDADEVGSDAVSPGALQVGFLAAELAVLLGPLAYGYIIRRFQGVQGIFDVLRNLVLSELIEPGLLGCGFHPPSPSLTVAARTKVRRMSLISLFKSFSNSLLSTGEIREPIMPTTRLGRPEQKRLRTAKNFV